MNWLNCLTIFFALAVLLSSCDAFEPDSLTELTGAKTEVERVYACENVFEEEAVRVRVLRDHAKTEADRALAIEWVAEADSISGKFITRLDGYSPADFKKASLSFNKKFTQSEFTALFEDYGRVLKAHCTEIL